jgi:cell wall-associated NlpC family hydrolase
MRPIRFLILLLVLTAALLVALVRPLPSRAGAGAAPGSTDEQQSNPEPRATRHLMSRPADATHAFGSRLVRYARRFLGVPYVYGGSSPRYGFDCSGFVRYVYGHFGISLPHSSFADLWRGRQITRRSLRPGDLVFFAGASHVGIYVGSDRFIDAPHTGTVVRISSMNSGWYGASYYGARRLHRS